VDALLVLPSTLAPSQLLAFRVVLLALTVETLTLRDLCQIMGVIEAAGAKFERPLIALVNEIEGFVCGGDQALPSATTAGDGRRVMLRATGL
jgi:hypothetical protein